nr:hypothetical protein [Methylorubrum aminovorans]
MRSERGAPTAMKVKRAVLPATKAAQAANAAGSPSMSGGAARMSNATSGKAARICAASEGWATTRAILSLGAITVRNRISVSVEPGRCGSPPGISSRERAAIGLLSHSESHAPS